MKFVSSLALAVMLSMGVSAVSAEPAAAQKRKKDEPQEPQLQVSEPFRKAAVAAQTALQAKDFTTADQQLTAAEALITNDDERYFAAALRLPLEANRNNNPGILKALDVLLASPKTPATEMARYNFLRGSLAFDLKREAEAIPYLERARQLGSTERDLPLLLARAYVNTGKVNEGIAEVDRAIQAETAAGRKAPEAWYSYAVSRLYQSGDRSATADWQMRQVRAFPSAENWRKILIVYRDSLGKDKKPLDKAQRLDLFRLMRSIGALADQSDYFDYASAALDRGLPWEAVSAVDAGKAAGKVPAGSADFTRVYNAAQTAVKGEQPLAAYEKQAVAAATGSTAAETGDAYLASGNYAKAAEMYALALTKGGVNESDVNLHLGVALANLGRKDEAKAAFAKVTTAPNTDIARFWTAWLETPPAA